MPDSIEALLPHRPPFRFVDRLGDVADERASFTLHLDSDDLRLRDGIFPPLLLVEALAQSAAAFHAAHFHSANAVQERGMLVEISHAELLESAHGGQEVALHIERTHKLGPMVRFAGHADVAGRTLVRAVFTVARQVEPTS